MDSERRRPTSFLLLISSSLRSRKSENLLIVKKTRQNQDQDGKEEGAEEVTNFLLYSDTIVSPCLGTAGCAIFTTVLLVFWS